MAFFSADAIAHHSCAPLNQRTTATLLLAEARRRRSWFFWKPAAYSASAATTWAATASLDCGFWPVMRLPSRTT